MKTKEEIFKKFELKDENDEGTDCIWYDDALLAMQEYAELYHDNEVKKLTLHDVRKALIDFLQYMWETDFDRKGLAFDDYVDEYLKSINVA